MVQFGEKPSTGTLFRASQFLSEELPIRLAHRVQELSDLPDGLNEMPSICRVRDWYAQSFEVRCGRFLLWSALTHTHDRSLLNSHDQTFPPRSKNDYSSQRNEMAKIRPCCRSRHRIRASGKDSIGQRRTVPTAMATQAERSRAPHQAGDTMLQQMMDKTGRPNWAHITPSSQTPSRRSRGGTTAS